MFELDAQPFSSEFTRSFEVRYTHRIFFTRGAAGPENPVLDQALGSTRRVLVAIEESVEAAHPTYSRDLIAKLGNRAVPRTIRLPGGETCKQDTRVCDTLTRAIHESGIDRHSALLAIGGGAFLDAAGFAAATAHRGVQLVRFPTTTLAQADSGVGVKNGLNTFGKKNFTGSFAVPLAVVNDLGFLSTQKTKERSLGLVEALKVALLKDPDFFTWIAQQAGAIRSGESSAIEAAVVRSARLHFDHITLGGDPFERGSSRPLDFGHWAAHKLESLSGHGLSHAEAVSIGLALDVTYSMLAGWLAPSEGDAILDLLERLDWPTSHPLLAETNAGGQPRIADGLDEFREHLGGELTLIMLEGIGRPREIHVIDPEILARALDTRCLSPREKTSRNR